MYIPEGLNYTNTHEWIKKLDNGILEIGLSDYAQQELGDIVFINLPKTGDTLKAGSVFADVESVKAVSEIYSPMDCRVIEINQDLLNSPELVNQSPYTAWLVRIECGVVDEKVLLSADEYRALII